jgi:RHS repeat-associated protein
VTVTISTTTTGAQIRYTLDGANWTVIANNGTATFQPGVAGKTLTAIAFKAGMSDSNPHSEYYWYDNGRFSETIRTVTYNFDGAGNRSSVVDTGVTTTYTLDPNNNLNEYSQVGADAVINGSEHEISMYQSVSYAYINDEHLKSASSGANTYQLYYDALGRSVKRTVNGATTYYIYDGEKAILEYRSNDLTHPVRNVYGKGIDEILMRTDPTVNGAAAFYYQQDHEGSVTHLTNEAGSVIEKYRYDAFGLPTVYDGAGNLRANGTIYNNRFLFTGREYAATYIPAFKFYEYRARAYNPVLGRFMSEDPKLFDAGDYNLFRYCHNDPVDFTDPMGEAPEWVHTTLDITGTLEPTPFSDAVNAGLYANEGRWGNAGVSIAGVLPYVGDLGKAGRLTAKAGKLFSKEAKASRQAATNLAANTGRHWNPLNGPGPLGKQVAATFRSASYTESVTSEATTFYRVYGGKAGELGSYWTRTPPTGRLQSQIDSALLSQWGNTAQKVTRIQVPPGTKIFEGFAAPRGGLVGGGNQVFIPRVDPSWIVK